MPWHYMPSQQLVSLNKKSEWKGKKVKKKILIINKYKHGNIFAGVGRNALQGVVIIVERRK